ncbi:uncharacterized protein N7458_008338 [Penicillium daleae]|uniref:Uncharacterized protein n=1 Tax=Penicillium daleae TaxID=63821 RepID=A0AAD6C2P5_9EURO|nr:uncharacterized protein N7458_008338 [Penicillium daleae]KAJ5444466.1 hypothetical protein N7458_008338 [Penicillium daleae]
MIDEGVESVLGLLGPAPALAAWSIGFGGLGVMLTGPLDRPCRDMAGTHGHSLLGISDYRGAYRGSTRCSRLFVV